MITKSFKALSLFTLIFISQIDAEYLNSDYWPQFVENKSEILDKNGDTLVKKFQRGVLLRLEEGLLLIDFGRNGVHQVEIEKTDFETNYLKIKNKEIEKLAPNLTAMIGPRLVTYSVNYKTKSFESFKIVEKYNLILVADSERAQKELKRFNKRISKITRNSDKELVILMPNSQAIYKFCKKHKLDYYMIMPGVVDGYRNAFQLGDYEADFQLIQLDANGQILDRYPSTKSLKSIFRALKS